VKTPITYYGGKQNMVRHIIPLIPEHRHYIEPFFGGGAIFFAKESAKLSTINDTNSVLINFYRVCQDMAKFKKLKKMIDYWPHSREVFLDARSIYKGDVKSTDIERAWAVWYCFAAGFSGSGRDYSFTNNAATNAKPKELQSKKERFGLEIFEKLKDAQIENTDAIKIIGRCAPDKDAFYFVDPPYIGANQGHYKGYTEEHFEDLLKALSKVEGKFILTCYKNDLVEKYAAKNKWHRKPMAFTENQLELMRAAVARRWPDGKVSGGKLIPAGPCPNCGQSGKWSLWQSACTYSCFACQGGGNLWEFVKDDVLPYLTASEKNASLSPIEREIIKYRKVTGKKHRLSDAVVRKFGLTFDPTASTYGSVVWPVGGVPVRWLQTYKSRTATDGKPGWKAIKGRPGRVCLSPIDNLQSMPPGPVLFVEGEWDAMAAWEHLGTDSVVYIAGGAGAVTEHTDTSTLLGWLNSKHEVVICYDTDGPGQRGAKALARNIALNHKVANIKMLSWRDIRAEKPGIVLEAGSDLEDVCRAGILTRANWQAFVAGAPAFDIHATAQLATRPNTSALIDPQAVAAAPAPPPHLAHLNGIFAELFAIRGLSVEHRQRAMMAIANERMAEISEHVGITEAVDIEAAVGWLTEKLEGEVAVAALKHFAHQIVQDSWIVREPGIGIAGQSQYWRFNGRHFAPIDDDAITTAAGRVRDLVAIGCETIARQAASTRHARAMLLEAMAACEERQITRHIDTEHLALSDGVLRLDDLALLPFSHKFNFRAVNEDISWADSDGEPTNWLALFEQALGREQSREMWKFIYMTLSVFPRPQQAAFFFGDGGASKGLLADAIQALVGQHQSSALSLEQLETSPHASAGMVGKTLNVCDELRSGGHINSAVFKAFVGGSQISVNPKFRESYPYTFQAQFIIPTNHLPNPADWSDAFERRLYVFHFSQFDRSKKDPRYFIDKLKPELAKALRYALTYGREAWEADKCQLMPTTEGRRLAQTVMSADPVVLFWQSKIADAGETTDWHKRALPEWARLWDAHPNGRQMALHVGALFDEFREFCDAGGFARLSVVSFGRRSADFWNGFIRCINEGKEPCEGVQATTCGALPDGERLVLEKNQVFKKNSKSVRGLMITWQSVTDSPESTVLADWLVSLYVPI
jgi:DNA adenine methylase